MSETRIRFLHRIYSRTGHWGWRVSRRIRAFGWGVLLVTIIAAVLGTNIEDSAIYMIFCVCMSVIVVSSWWVLFRDAKVSAKRELPQFGTQGRELQYSITVQNNHSKPLKAMLFEEWPSTSSPSFETFAHTPEPGEERRNIVDRLLLYYRWCWLQERKRGFDIVEASQVPRSIASNSSDSIRLKFIPQYRGIIELKDLRILLPDPFGLLQRCISVHNTLETITILPKHYPLNQLSFIQKAHLNQGEENPSNRIGQTKDFLHLRDYHSGDAVRSIDWKSWARTGTPVVREYEEHLIPSYGVLLDTSGHLDAYFEEAVSVAASFIAHSINHSCHLNVMYIGERAYRFHSKKGTSQYKKLLKILATLENRQKTHFQNLRETVLRTCDSLAMILLIFPGWNSERQRLFSELQQKLNEKVFALVIADEELEQTLKNSSSTNIHLLRLGQVGSDLSRIIE